MCCSVKDTGVKHIKSLSAHKTSLNASMSMGRAQPILLSILRPILSKTLKVVMRQLHWVSLNRITKRLSPCLPACLPTCPSIHYTHTKALAPLIPRIHRIRLARHPHHPPLHQILVLLLQARARIIRRVELQLQRQHLVLHLLQQVLFAAQLGRLVTDLAGEGVALGGEDAEGLLLGLGDGQEAVAVVSGGAEAGL